MVMLMESIERIGSWIPADSHIIAPVTGSVGGGLSFKLPKLVTSNRIKKVVADAEVAIAANKHMTALKNDRFFFIISLGGCLLMPNDTGERRLSTPRDICVK